MNPFTVILLSQQLRQIILFFLKKTLNMTPCLGPNAKFSSVCQPPPPISSPVPASSLFSGTAARVHFNTVFSTTLMHTNVSTLEAASDCCSDVWIQTCRQHFSHNEPDVLLSNTSPD